MKDDLYVEKTVMLIEDSPDDHEAFVRSFKKAGMDFPITWAPSGEEALSFLRASSTVEKENTAAQPALIFLDLNMPGLDGRQVLEMIKEDEKLKHIPVIIMTTSSNNRDIWHCYQMGANTYIQKPVSFKDLVALMGNLKQYWFDTALLPASYAPPVAVV